MAETWITVGEITAPQGVRGDVRVLPVTDFPERLSALPVCRVQTPNGTVVSYDIESVRPHKGFYLFRLAGIDTRNAAETLRGCRVVVPRSEVMPLPAGRYYNFELVGMSVFTHTGESIGTLQEVLSGYGNDCFVIKRVGKPDALVPAVKEFVTSIDVAGRRMEIRPIPGLLDEAEGEDRE